MRIELPKILSVAVVVATTFAFLFLYQGARHPSSEQQTRGGNIISQQERRHLQSSSWGAGWGQTTTPAWPQISWTQQQQQQPSFSNPTSFSRTQQQQQQQQSSSWTQQRQQSFPNPPAAPAVSWEQQQQPPRQDPQQQQQPQGRFFSSFIPFFEPRQYSLHPTSAFELNVLCTDSARSGCTPFNTGRSIQRHS